MTRSKLFFAIPLTLVAFSAFGKDKHPKNSDAVAQDEINVVAHLPLTGGPVRGFLETQHYRRNYLYAEHESGKTVSLIDITSAAKPALLADMAFPAGGSDNLVAVAGNAALVSSQTQSAQAVVSPQNFRIMSFADPLHPTVKQQFDNVTAISRDKKRGLIFLANDSGIWILQRRYAQDPEAEKEWEHMMLDNR
jgi:hypothetical protein